MPKRPLISADNHVFEPVTLWQERLPNEYHDRGPRVEQRDGWVVMAIEGMPDRKLTRTDGDSSAGEASSSHEAGMRAGGFDLDGRLARHGARRRDRRGDLPDVRAVHRHGPGAGSPDGVRAGLQRLARRVVPRIGPTCSSRPRSCRCVTSRRRPPSSNASRNSGSRPR